MHIDQRLEAVLLAAVEEPVDRTLLIGFQMVGIEVIQEVAADNLAGRTLAAERICDELEVFFQRFLAVDSFHPLHKASSDVIIKVVIVANGNDIVTVRNDGLVPAFVPFAARIGKTVHIQRIPSEHTAHGIGNERTNIPSEISPAYCDILVLNFWRKLVLQAVEVNKEPVEFFLVDFELLESTLRSS